MTRRRIDKPDAIGRDKYVVVDETGASWYPVQPLAPLALVRAQDMALRWPSVGIEVVFSVYREPPYGPRVELYRVVRQADGSVSTFTVERVD